MIRLRALQLIGLPAIVCLFSSLAHAQGMRLFAMGSGSYLLNEKFFAVGSDKFRSNYASGGKVTFGGELTPWKILGIEAAYGIGRNNLRISDLDPALPDEAGYGIRVQRYSGNLVLHSPIALGGLRPYLTGGLEYTRFGPTSGAKTQAFTQGFADQAVVLESSNKLGVNLGGGVEWDFFPTLALRLDVRNHTTGTPTYGLSQPSTAGAIFPVSGKANNLEISAGITFRLGP